MWLKGDVCHALNTESFTSSCQIEIWCTVMVPGTIADNIHSVWRTALFLNPRDLLLLGLALRLSCSCLPMPQGNLCCAGGWHLRRMPCVELFFVLLFSSTAMCVAHVALFRFTLSGFSSLFRTLCSVSSTLFSCFLHVGVENGSNTFVWLFLPGSREACASLLFPSAPF